MEKPSVSSSRALAGKIMPEQAGNRKSMPSVIVIYNLLKIQEWEVFAFGRCDPVDRNLSTASGGRIPWPRFETKNIEHKALEGRP
ncbi:hypothetical protein [Rhizobium leguminosarum]|uniref:hypothetical protein n=1 Tax=Rhizobium leguminosarum TaxID=384 RepID=UPI001FDA9150|nr:hypothetical protein [Rhizobium leguminosarum]